MSDFYIKILKEILFTSEEEVLCSLEEGLPVLSRRGSQDDMSVACIYDEDRVVENIGYILEYQISLVKSRMDASDRRVNELISRKQDLEHYLEVKNSWRRWSKEKEELEQKLKISSSTNIDIEIGFADKDIVREKTAKEHLNRKQESLVSERSKIQEVKQRMLTISSDEELAGDMGVELAEIVPVVPDPVEQGPQPTDSMSLPDDAIEIIEVTECKGLTGKEPYYIHPTPSEPKNDEVK